MTTIYHNPRCTKSRLTLALLEEKGLSPTVIEYLQTPPDAEELTRITTLLGIGPRDLIRTGEAVYKELGLGDASDTDLIKAMVENPILIERPIVLANGKARIGRPPENVIDIL